MQTPIFTKTEKHILHLGDTNHKNMKNYEERKQEKIERFKELAAKKRAESSNRFKSAHDLGQMIPFGQPILVGHHSERRHRSDLNKIDNNMRKSIELDGTAEYYERKAKSLENNRVISSDDPEAVTKLREKLDRLQKSQELMKSANKVIKGKGTDAEKIEILEKLGIPKASRLLEPNYCGRVGFEPYALQNNNANMSTIKKRIAKLERASAEELSEKEINGVKIVDNPEANRLQMFFDGKPSQETRTELKRNGFRWSPSNGCWQAYRNYHVSRTAEEIANKATF